jgi:hypothetical protein
MQKNDHPILLKKDDSLGRDSFARIIAQEIQSLDVSQG